jgi:hypothetical protein
LQGEQISNKPLHQREELPEQAQRLLQSYSLDFPPRKESCWIKPLTTASHVTKMTRTCKSFGGSNQVASGVKGQEYQSGEDGIPNLHD